MIAVVLVPLAVVGCAVCARAGLALTRSAAVLNRLASPGEPMGPTSASGECAKKGPAGEFLHTRPNGGPRARRGIGLLKAPARLVEALAAADIALDGDMVWTAWSALVGVGVLTGLGADRLALSVIALSAVTAGAWGVVRARRGRSDEAMEAALPGVLEGIARNLRAGSSLSQAIAEVAGETRGRAGAEWQRLAWANHHGLGLVNALEDLVRRCPLRGVRLAVAALALGAETGGAQARAIDGVATTLRDRISLVAEVRALSSQARMSALVIALAPVGFAAFASATDARTSQFLFGTDAGLVLLAGGLGLDGLGALWMNRLSRIAA